MLHRTNTTTLKNLAGKIFSVIFPVFSLLFLSFLFVVTIYETLTHGHSSEKNLLTRTLKNMDYFKWLIVYNLNEFEIMNSINVSTLFGASRKIFYFYASCYKHR